MSKSRETDTAGKVPGLTACATYLSTDDKGATNWRVTLRYQGREMNVKFTQGSACDKRGPDALTVLCCIALDSQGYYNAGSFEAWAPEYGYDTDSRKAEAIYRECAKQAADLTFLLGEDYDAIVTSDAVVEF